MMSYSVQLRAVRAYFGFTQLALAPWLGLSRALLASVETGREQLPAHARPWLGPWLAALAAAVPEPAAPAAAPLPEVPPTTGPGPGPVLARLAECRYQVQRLGRQCAALQATHCTAVRRLAAGPLLLAALPLPVAAEATELALRRCWLARLLEAATDALAPEAATGPVALLLLEARQQAWWHEATWLRTRLASGV